jgi:ankyrin repeat protein
VCDFNYITSCAIRIRFQNVNTLFHTAAMKGHVDAMKYLVELGAKYDEKDNVSC